MEAGVVGRKPRAFYFHPAERSGRHLSIWLTTPRTAPVLRLSEFERCCPHEELDDILIAQPVAGRDRVVKVVVEVYPML